MDFQDRWYQNECSEALAKDILESNGNIHPIGVVPTAGGKSIILCKVIDILLSSDPTKNILILSHVSDILSQNYKKVKEYFNDIDVGLYSAGLESKTIHKITIAGIQSVHSKPELFQDYNYVLIDECHLINKKKTGMYRNFLSKIKAVYAGLTATHFRTGQGYLHTGKDALFNKISYDLSSYENYNKLVAEGWLSELIPLPTDIQMDTEGLGTRGGEFKEEELSERFVRYNLTKQICERVVKYGKKYKKWLIFSIDKNHADMINEILKEMGISIESVYSGMKTPKSYVLKKYRNGEYRALVNVNMLITGVDIPDIDLIVHMRPSQSPVFHVQSNGRGGRVVYADGYDLNTIQGRLDAIANGSKPHCLVLDFAGNTQRLGPINGVTIKEPGDKKGGGGPMAKPCPECGVLNHLAAKKCICCWAEFPTKEKLTKHASTLALIKKEGVKNEQWIEVINTSYSIHEKKGAPSSLRATYNCGLMSFSQLVFIGYSGWARNKALAWVRNRYVGKNKIPDNLSELWAARYELRGPSHILVNVDGEYPEIKNVKFEKGDNLMEKPFAFSKKEWDNYDEDIPF